MDNSNHGDPLSRTESGTVIGRSLQGLYVFYGIPYASPPFDALRFRPPQPAERWDGIREALHQGPAAPQPAPHADDPWAPLYAPRETGTDCLTLDIWTPDLGAAKLPVVVHIHGGGYLSGSGTLPVHSGRTYARDGIVHVSINYRLGIDGFLFLGDGHDNLGLRDQIAALEWVQRNISNFGGDPDRVTILGQSAGAVSVMTLLATPVAKPLFTQAIAQSGTPIASMDIETAERQTRQVARRLRIAPTVQSFASLTLDQTTAMAQKMATRFLMGLLRGNKESLLLTPFRTVHGTELLPASPLAGAADSTVPLLAGTVRNETVGFIEGLSLNGSLRPLVRCGLNRAIGIRNLKDAYAEGARQLSDNNEIVEAAWTDWGFRMPTIALLERRPGASWLYEFRWAAERDSMGSVHGIDLPFGADLLPVTEKLGADARRFFAGAPQHLATLIHDSFVRFISKGSPGWARYNTGARATMLFENNSMVEPDAAGAERLAWEDRNGARLPTN